MPATSSTMSNELAESEYGVMSAAQLLATQVGEVAGIQVVLTIQESIARRAGLADVHHSTALLHSFSVPFWVGAGVAALAVVCALFIRPLPRRPAAPRTGGRRRLTHWRRRCRPGVGYSVMSRSRAASLGRVGVGRGRRGLQRHQLGHVALDPHLARP